MIDDRLPAHLEVSGLCRAVEAAGGFAVIVQRGERDAGVVLVVTMDRGRDVRLWERMPQLDGSRKFILTKIQDTDNKIDFEDYLDRRRRADPDCWMIELDIADAARFVDSALQ